LRKFTPTAGPPRHADDDEQAERAEGRQLLPRRAAHEQHRGERGHVDERRTEVGLEEDEDDRDRAERERPHRCAHVGSGLRALGEEAGDCEHEQELPELGRLERERPDGDPPRRAARRMTAAEQTSAITPAVAWKIARQ
jgi:hypothetical protein